MKPLDGASLRLADGARLRYIDQGHGDPIVLIHGFPGHLDYSWARAIDLFALRDRVIAMDLLGFGWSDRPRDADYGRPAQADRIATLLDSLDVREGTVIGASFGGGVAQHLAAIRPDIVSRLVLVSSEDASVPSGLLDSSLALQALVGALGLPIVGPRIGRMATRALSAPDMRDPETIERGLAPLLRPWTLGWIRKVLRDLRDEPALQLSAIRSPTLIISSDGDESVPPAVGEAIAEKIPGARHVVLSGLPHGYWGRRPEILARTLIESGGSGAQAGT